MVDFLNVCIQQLNDLRGGFKGDHADHRHVARVFKYAVAYTARARIAACNKATNGGDVPRAGVHQNLLSTGHHIAGAHRALQVSDQDAGLAGHGSGRNIQHPVELRDVQNDAAFHGHALAIVAGTAAAYRDVDAMLRAGCGHADNILLRARGHHHVAYLAVQQLGEYRAVPKIVSRLGSHLGSVLREFNRRNFGQEALQCGHGGVNGQTVKNSPARITRRWRPAGVMSS